MPHTVSMSKENLVEYSHDFNADEEENFDFEGEDLDGQAEVDAGDEPATQPPQTNAVEDPAPDSAPAHTDVPTNGEAGKPPAAAVRADVVCTAYRSPHQPPQAAAPAAATTTLPDFASEWADVDIPRYLWPLPLIRVRNVPATTSLDAVRDLLERQGVSVHDIIFDDSMIMGSKTAIVRLPPPPPPWRPNIKDEPGYDLLQISAEGDVSVIAAKVASQLTVRE